MVMNILNIKRIVIVLAMMVVGVVSASAQTAGEYLKMTDAVPDGYKFWYFVPEDY